jgi:chlorobactene glucosyltransferase
MIFFSVITVVSLALLALVVWNVAAWPKVKRAVRVWPKSVSVLIPARNEEANLPDCLNAVLRQGETILEVLVYDDHSTDSTHEVTVGYGDSDARVRLVAAESLPAGWCGKNFACARLAAAASGEWLLFLDADARLAEGAAARIIDEARRRDLTLLSCWPRLTLAGFWEKVLMPMLNFVVFTLFPAPLSISRQDPSLGLAHGACLLVHRETYMRVGGHGAVRNQIQDDGRLARLWREHGERGLCLDGSDIVGVRMYRALPEIWLGFQKNFYPIFHRESSFWAFLALHLLVFLAPFVVLPLLAIKSTHFWIVWLAGTSMFVMRLLLAARFGHPKWSALLHPLAECMLIALGLSSWWKCKSGSGVEWKGRRYKTVASRQ